MNPSAESEDVEYPRNEEPAQPPRSNEFGRAFWAAIRRYVNPKRLVMLMFFSLLAGNSVTFFVQFFAEAQILGVTKNHHAKVFQSFERAVERNRKLLGTAQQGMQISQVVSSLNALSGNMTGGMNGSSSGAPQSTNGVTNKDNQTSPWWLALQDVKKEFPSLRIKILMPSQKMDAHERKLLDSITNRPRGHSLSDEKEGWAQSVFLLPTRNTAALSVVSYIRDDWTFWRDCSLEIGFCTFLMFLLFGWFWTRAETSNENDGERAKHIAEVTQRIAAIRAVMAEIGALISDLKLNLHHLESRTQLSNNPVLKNLEDVVSHIHLLAINGGIEAVRSPETSRVFQSLLQEMNQLATRSRRLIGKLQSEDRSAFVAIEEKFARVEDMLKKAS